MYDNFLFRAKRTVYKWWCIVYKPVYKLIHNGEWPEEKEPDVKYAAPKQASQPAALDAQALANAVLDTNRQSQHNIDDLVSEVAHMSAEPTAFTPDTGSTASTLNPEEIPAGVDDDVLARANEIMARLNREAAEDEEKKQREIEAAKEKAIEQERLAAILKSTERNIDAFIQEGLSKQHQQDDGN